MINGVPMVNTLLANRMAIPPIDPRLIGYPDDIQRTRALVMAGMGPQREGPVVMSNPEDLGNFPYVMAPTGVQNESPEIMAPTGVEGKPEPEVSKEPSSNLRWLRGAPDSLRQDLIKKVMDEILIYERYPGEFKIEGVKGIATKYVNTKIKPVNEWTSEDVDWMRHFDTSYKIDQDIFKLPEGKSPENESKANVVGGGNVGDESDLFKRHTSLVKWGSRAVK